MLLAPLFTPTAAQTRQAPHGEALVLKHVTVINVAAQDAERAIIPDQTVVITGNRITSAGRTGRVKRPAGARVIDASGKYLSTGLWDMHVHVFNNSHDAGTNEKDSYFPLFIANGVTGVRDMWKRPRRPEAAAPVAAGVRRGDIDSPAHRSRQ